MERNVYLLFYSFTSSNCSYQPEYEERACNEHNVTSSSP